MAVGGWLLGAACSCGRRAREIFGQLVLLLLLVELVRLHTVLQALLALVPSLLLVLQRRGR